MFALSPVFLGAPAATAIASATFTAANGTLLSAYTSDSGHTFSKDAYGGAIVGFANSTIQSNKLSLVAANSSNYIFESISATPPSANYTVSVDVQVPGGVTGAFIGPMIRSDGNNNNYMTRLDKNGNSIDLYRLSAGGFIIIGTAVTISPALTATDTYNVALKGVGSALTVTVKRLADGFYLAPAGTFQASLINVLSGTDANITAAGKGGLMMVDTTAATGMLVDNFLIV